jgi:Zn/Cd-binding protein ZinT
MFHFHWARGVEAVESSLDSLDSWSYYIYKAYPNRPILRKVVNARSPKEEKVKNDKSNSNKRPPSNHFHWARGVEAVESSLDSLDSWSYYIYKAYPWS